MRRELQGHAASLNSEHNNSANSHQHLKMDTEGGKEGVRGGMLSSGE